MTIERYWEIILGKCAELDPDSAAAVAAAPPGQKHWVYRRSSKAIWLTSERNEEKGSHAGSTVLVNPFVAAECIYNHTHRLATDAEIQDELERQACLKEQIIAQDNAQRSPGVTLQVSPEALRAAIASAGLAPKE